MKINFSELKFEDINGNIIEENPDKPIYKLLANLIYQQTQVLDLVEIAREINLGNEVELRPNEIADIKRVIMESKISAFVKKVLISELDKSK